METFLLDVAACSPVIIVCAALLVAFISKDKRAFLFGILVIICWISNEGLKGLFQAILPLAPGIYRPNPPLSGCGVFANCSVSDSDKLLVGMPSGHAQTITFAFVLVALFLISKTGFSHPTTILQIVVLGIVAILIIYSRYYIGCHTLLQLFVGSMIGIALAAAVFFGSY